MKANEPVLVTTAGQLLESSLPGGPLPGPAAPAWATRRDALEAAAIVAGVVGVPALVAAGAVLMLFAMTAVVLLAPLLAAVLTWVVWRCNRRPSRRSARGEVLLRPPMCGRRMARAAEHR